MTKQRTLNFNDIIDKRITGNNRKIYSLPISDELLAKHNFFELYPLDGGGGLIFRQMFDTISDEGISEQILKRNGLNDWGLLPKLDFKKFERWGTIEKSCWINRFYFAASLGRAYWISKDERIARSLKDIILHFIRNYSPPKGKKVIGEHIHYVCHIMNHLYNKQTHEENQKDKTDTQYIWFDFQPASRIIHLLYFIHFLKDSKSVSQSEWMEIITSLYEHAELITIGERDFIKLERDNHQSLRGLALLFAGTFFKNFGLWKEFLEHGIRICNYHIKNEFLTDGTLYENSPSYHVFVTWHVRDAYLLSKSHNFNLCSDTKEILKKTSDFICAICEPDGYSTVVNDGYPVNLRSFLGSLPKEVCSNKPNSKTTVFFQNAGIGIYSDRKRYLLFDASPHTGTFSHYHAGKNAFTYWHDGVPFFIDSGCCSYDDPLFAEWYKQGKAHSSLLVNGTADGVVHGLYHWINYSFPESKEWQRTNNGYIISSNLKSNSPGWENVSWKREIEVLKDDGIVISDKIKTEQRKKVVFIFNLHPNVKTAFDAGNLLLDNNEVKLMLSSNATSKIKTSIAQGICFIDFEHRKGKRILIKAEINHNFAMKTKIENLKKLGVLSDSPIKNRSPLGS